MEEAEMMAVWGTWEELLLGGAVLRHGTHDWNAVASELRVRKPHYPCSFTPEICKAKYEELQRHYTGCIALFEELRKLRVAELKRSLEQSDDSIGSLQSKLRNLEAEKGDNCQLDYGSSQTESPMPFQKSDGAESSGKETSKDGLSAGSFIQETRTNWSPINSIPAAALAREMDTKPDISESSEQEKVSGMENLTETIQGEQGGNIRKRRGKRKRKDCNRDVKEGSVGESDFLGPADVVTVSQCKGNSTSDCGPAGGSSVVNNCYQGSTREGTDDLTGIFDFVVNNENAASFCRRHDSQKRARYKNLVRQHMDFDTIRSRIAKHSIKSARELFRDLLLLTNNALVFYSKTTREHKCALLLRDHVTKILRQNDQCPGNKTVAGPAVFFMSPISNAPVKPRSARPCNWKPSRKTGNARNIVAWISQVGKKSSKFDSLASAEAITCSDKGGTSHRGKGGRVLVRQQHEPPLKERKRAWRR